MPLLSTQLLFQMQEIVRKHHMAFVVAAFGEDAVPPSVLEFLKAQGLVKPGSKIIDDVYLYGQVLGVLEKPEVKGWSLDQLKEHLTKNPISLTPVEQSALKTAKLSAATYCQGLGNVVDKESGQLLIEADHKLREKLQGDIQDATAKAIEARKTVKQLKSDLGWATQDWTRNLDRIAITEMHNAMQQGAADSHANERAAGDHGA